MNKQTDDRRAIIKAIVTRLWRHYIERTPLPGRQDGESLSLPMLRQLFCHVLSEGYGTQSTPTHLHAVNGGKAIHIPVSADVQCADGPCGHATCVVLNPATRQVTHVVVREPRSPFGEYLVPIDQVAEATSSEIHLRCTIEELGRMEPFVTTEYVELNAPYYGAACMGPYFSPGILVVPVGHERTPPGEQAVHRGARVEATDGHVGRVDAFLVKLASGRITHLVLREGHFWGKKDVSIPVEQIARIQDDTVYLKLTRHGVEALPAVPVDRRAV